MKSRNTLIAANKILQFAKLPVVLLQFASLIVAGCTGTPYPSLLTQYY